LKVGRSKSWKVEGLKVGRVKGRERFDLFVAAAPCGGRGVCGRPSTVHLTHGGTTLRIEHRIGLVPTSTAPARKRPGQLTIVGSTANNKMLWRESPLDTSGRAEKGLSAKRIEPLPHGRGTEWWRRIMPGGLGPIPISRVQGAAQAQACGSGCGDGNCPNACRSGLPEGSVRNKALWYPGAWRATRPNESRVRIGRREVAAA